MKGETSSKIKVLEALKKVFPLDLSIKEIAKSTGLSVPTVSTWLKVLEAEKKIEVTRTVGNAVFYRIIRDGVDSIVSES
jgi:DNA-binding Lrp family transcriptional regulator